MCLQKMADSHSSRDVKRIHVSITKYEVIVKVCENNLDHQIKDLLRYVIASKQIWLL